MSDRARHVLALLTRAEQTRERHPTLFAAQLRAGEKTGRDRDVRHLAAALDRYKREKPTAHARPFRDEVEPVDPPAHVLEDDRARHTRDRLRADSRRREARLKLSGLALIREVLREMDTISTVKAGSIEPSRGGNETGGVPFQQQLADDPRWQLAEEIIKRQALGMCELIDEARGQGRAGAIADLSPREKDEAILHEGRGLTAEETFYRLGPWYGSISYIRKLRRSNGLDSKGYEREAE